MKDTLIFCGIILCGTVSDLLSKWWIFGKYKEIGYVDLVPGFLGIICSKNEGIVFGLFQGSSNALIYFTPFAMGLIVWIFYKSNKAGKASKISTIGLGIILGGASGNLWDRVFYHSVRDFIDIHLGRYHWPTFNIADLLICFGVGLLILKTLSAKDTKHKISTRNI